MTAAAEPVGTLARALANAVELLGTQPALAAEQAEEILKVMPEQPQARLLLGAARRRLGDPAGAVDVLARLVGAHADWAQAQFELGLALGRLGRGQAAVAALRRAVALEPGLAEGWRVLGDHLSAMGDADGADEAYSRHVQAATRDPRLLEAAVALNEQRLPEAERLLKQHLMRAPTDVAAIRMLAELAGRLGRNEDAANLLTRCLELAPSFAAARFNYALVLHRLGRSEESLAELERLLAEEPANPGPRGLKAAVLSRLGDYARAIPLYEALLAEYPDQAKLWLSYGHALKTAGRQADAVAAYRECTRLQPSFGEPWWSLANLKTFRFTAEDVAAMRGQLARPELDGEDRLHFDFALGKALEDAGEYAASFGHYAAGNALRRARHPYSPDDTSLRVRNARATFTPEFYAARAGWGAPAPDPIFVVGLPRSGSTLIEQILSSHPQVEGTMELPDIISLVRRLRARGRDDGVNYHEEVLALSADEARALGEEYLERTRVQRPAGRPFFIDKMPNNWAHVGLIQLILPNAKIVDARRHPLACCFSNFKQHFARGQNFAYGLDDLGRYYHDYVALMSHFDAVRPGRVHRVIYERMVEDTEAEVRRLLDYCGLEFDPACLRFYENERAVRTASSEQVRRPIYRDGVDQWRNYDEWLGPLRAALGPVLDCYPAPPPA